MEIKEVKSFINPQKEGNFYILEIIVRFSDEIAGEKEIHFKKCLGAKIKCKGEWYYEHFYKITNFIAKFESKQEIEEKMSKIVKELHKILDEYSKTLAKELDKYMKDEDIF